VAPVLKVHTKLLARFWLRRSAAPVVIVAVYVVLGASVLVGVKIALLLVGS
jgi:hypothetical protein